MFPILFVLCMSESRTAENAVISGIGSFYKAGAFFKLDKLNFWAFQVALEIPRSWVCWPGMTHKFFND